MSVIPTGRPDYPVVIPESPPESMPPVSMSSVGASARPQGSVDASLLRGRTVLVIGINYWPEVTGIGPYTTAMAEELVRCGSIVTVLAGVPHYPSWRGESGVCFPRLPPPRHKRVDVLGPRHPPPPKQTGVRRRGD